MKINSELERVLLGEQSKLNKPKSSPDNSTVNGFGNLLSDEINAQSTQKTNGSESVDTSKRLSETLNTSTGAITAAAVNSSRITPTDDQDIVNSLVSGIENTLEGLSTYSSSLQDPANLKSAWSSLNAMNQDISKMQRNFTQLSSKNPSIGSMLNDLEVTAVTETYKFNRGDYL